MTNSIVQRISQIEKKKIVLELSNIASDRGVRLEGNFVSKIVINFQKRNPFASEVSLLSKDLKFKPTENLSH